jgi:hypothetical protein
LVVDGFDVEEIVGVVVVVLDVGSGFLMGVFPTASSMDSSISFSLSVAAFSNQDIFTAKLIDDLRDLSFLGVNSTYYSSLSSPNLLRLD